jgi:hypothetical protein
MMEDSLDSGFRRNDHQIESCVESSILRFAEQFHA